MPEGISENQPPKKPETLAGIIERMRRGANPPPQSREAPSPPKSATILPKPAPLSEEVRERIRKELTSPPEEKKPGFELYIPDLETNIQASKIFIRELRNSALYEQDSNPDFMKSRLGFRVEKPVEAGKFDLLSVLTVAKERYKLPMAVYVGRDNHARLVVKGFYDTPTGKKITVYNPFNSGFEEIPVKFDANGQAVGVWKGNIYEPLQKDEYDLMKVFEHPKLVPHRALLTSIKAFGFQNDAINCVPYCLFVNAMLHGFEPGNTGFRLIGLKQFEQDFGFNILTREGITGEALPKRARIIG